MLAALGRPDDREDDDVVPWPRTDEPARDDAPDLNGLREQLANEVAAAEERLSARLDAAVERLTAAIAEPGDAQQLGRDVAAVRRKVTELARATKVTDEAADERERRAAQLVTGVSDVLSERLETVADRFVEALQAFGTRLDERLDDWAASLHEALAAQVDLLRAVHDQLEANGQFDAGLARHLTQVGRKVDSVERITKLRSDRIDKLRTQVVTEVRRLLADQPEPALDTSPITALADELSALRSHLEALSSRSDWQVERVAAELDRVTEELVALRRRVPVTAQAPTTTPPLATAPGATSTRREAFWRVRRRSGG